MLVIVAIQGPTFHTLLISIARYMHGAENFTQQPVAKERLRSVSVLFISLVCLDASRTKLNRRQTQLLVGRQT